MTALGFGVCAWLYSSILSRNKEVADFPDRPVARAPRVDRRCPRSRRQGPPPAGISSDALINQLEGQVAIASGSACSSGAIEPSYVLRAMGVEDSLLYSAVRVSFDRTHTIEYALKPQAIKDLRDLLKQDATRIAMKLQGLEDG
jgi:hypothetical protein